MGFSKNEALQRQINQEGPVERATQNSVLTADATITIDKRPNRRNFFTLIGVLSASLLAACNPDATPAPTQPSSGPSTAEPQISSPEPKKEAVISLTAEKVVPDCLTVNQTGVIEVKVDISGEGASINNSIIQFPFTVLSGNADSVIITIVGSTEKILIRNNEVWEYRIGIEYEKNLTDSTTERGIYATEEPVPLLKYTGVNQNNQFCFDAPKTTVNGSLA